MQKMAIFIKPAFIKICSLLLLYWCNGDETLYPISSKICQTHLTKHAIMASSKCHFDGINHMVQFWTLQIFSKF